MPEKTDPKSDNQTIQNLKKELTRIKKTLVGLEREEKLLRSLIQHSSLGIVTVDKNLRVISCNPVFESLFQYKQSEIIGKNLDELIAGNDESLQEAKDYSAKTLSGHPIQGKGKRIRKDGTPIDIEFYAVPAIVDGEVAGAYGLYENVTERVRIGEELKKSEKRLERVFQSSPLGIGLVRNKIMLWHNQAMARMLGYPLGVLIGKEARIIYPDDEEYRRAGRRLKFLSTENKTAQVETRWVRKNGEVFDCHLWYSLFEPDPENPTVLVMAEDVSERKRMEELLKKSEKRYRQLIEASPLPTAVYNKQTLFLVNAATLKLFKASSKEDFNRKGLKDLVHPDVLPFVQERVDRLLKGESLQPAIGKFITFKGDIIEAEVFSVPITYQEQPAIMSVFSDVTEKRKAEARLREEESRYRELYKASKQQEELYRSLLNSSPDAIIVYNLRGEAEFVNPFFTKIFGWTFEEIKGKKIPFVPESEKETTVGAIEKLLETGAPVHGFETRRLTKDGRILSLSISASRYSDHTGKPAGILVVLRDITERIKAESIIHQSEKRFRDLFNSVSDLIYKQDLEGRFLSVNRALVNLLGYTPEEMIGLKGSEYMKEELKPLYDSEYLEAVKKTGHHQGISVYITKNGRKVYLEHKSILVKPKDGAPYISGIARDVTERIRADRRIRKLREEMLQAQKMEAIGTLAGGIAHDFNNILMGIQGSISLLKLNMSEDSPDYERLQNIEESIRSGSELTSQLLGFARGGRYEVEPTDLNALIEKEVRLFGRAKKEIVIHLKLLDNLWTVEVDRGQIEQVLLNLFVNAWQAMPNGGQLFIQTKNKTFRKPDRYLRTMRPGRYVKVRITDTGIGMDKETQKRIFEPFFTTKEKGRGTGLGLASVYGIIKNHGGTIEVESAPGEGSTFMFYLPASNKKVRPKSEIPEKLAKGKGRILLIDDEERILDVGQQLLVALGYDVKTCNRGREAIEIFQKENGKFDLVILDMIMPGMGGRDIFQALRGVDPQVKVLLASGYSIDGEASKIMEMGCNGFIQKPFSMEKLSKKIQEILATG